MNASEPDCVKGCERTTVSVVIPVYNAAATISRALDSVARQTVLPTEVICIDDGSADDSVAIVENYKNGAPFRLELLALRRNRGVAHARNAGLKLASSRYVAFLDSDDSWPSNKIEIQVNAMVNHGFSITGSHSVRHDEGIGPRSLDAPRPVSPWQVLFKNPFHTSSVIVDSTCNLTFAEDGYLSEDFGAWLSMIGQGYSAAYFGTPLSYMHKASFGEAGLSSNLWRMERGELHAIWKQRHRFGSSMVAIAMAFSVVKFLKRVAVTRVKIISA